MAKAGAIKAGEAFIRLFADDSALRKGLDQAAAKLKAFGTGLAAAGAAFSAIGVGALGGLFAAGKAFSDVGDAVDKMNKRTGLSTEFISEMGFVAGQSGTSIEDLEKGFRKFQQTLGDAAAGNAAAAEAIAAVGLSVEALMAMSPDEQFYAVAEAVAAIQNEAVRTEAAMALLGRAATQLLPLFQEGAAGIDKLRKQARDLGLTFDAEAAASAAALNDALDALNQSVKALWVTIGGALAPALTKAAQLMAPIVAYATAWVRENKGVVVAFAQGAIAATVLGGALLALGGAFLGLGLAAAAASAIVGAVAATVAFLLTPVGALIAAVGVGAGVVAKAAIEMTSLADAMEWAKGRAAELGEVATQAFGAMAAAIEAGDMQLAAEAMWTGLLVAWKVGVAALNDVWQGIRVAAVSTFNETVAGVLMIWNDFTSAIDSAFWVSMKSVMNAWTSVDAFLRRSINSASGWVADRMLEIQGAFDPEFDVEAAKEIRRTNDAATNEQINQERDDAIARRDADFANLAREQESRRMAEQERLTAELVKREQELQESAEASRKAREEEIAILRQKLEYLGREAELARTNKAIEQELAKRAAAASAASAASSLREVSFAGFSGRALEAFRPDAIKGPVERTAKATENIDHQVRGIARSVNQLAEGLAFA